MSSNPALGGSRAPYEISTDPLDRLEAGLLQEKAAGRTAPEMKAVYDEKLKMWSVSVPGSSLQVFRGQTPQQLIEVLARAQWNATEHIRHQTHLLKQQFSEANSGFGEILQSYGENNASF